MPASCSRLTYFFAEQQTLSLKILKKSGRRHIKPKPRTYVSNRSDQLWQANLMPIFDATKIIYDFLDMFSNTLCQAVLMIGLLLSFNRPEGRKMDHFSKTQALKKRQTDRRHRSMFHVP